MSSKKLLTIVKPNTQPLDANRIMNWKEHRFPGEVRASGEFEGKALFLPGNYEWVLGYDDAGIQILVALIPQEDINP